MKNEDHQDAAHNGNKRRASAHPHANLLLTKGVL